MTKRCFLLGVCLTGLLAGQGKAQKKPVFLSAGVMGAVSMIAPPPAIDSVEMARAVGEIYALHRSATPKERAAAVYDNDHEDIFAIGRVLGSQFTEANLPATVTFWNDVNNDLGLVVTAAKTYFQEVRPYDLDPNIKSICGSKPGGAKSSYPSGHASVGYASAMILGMMIPERSAELHARADEYGKNRVVCGDHYAADIEGSKVAAAMALGAMAGSAKYQQEFAAAKAEIRKVMGL